MTDRSFEKANDESRERLARLVAGLTPSQLAIDLGGGWTVASAIAHVGFFDRFQAGRWTKMLAGEWSSDDESLVVAEHLALDALDPYWARMDSPDLSNLALEAAARLDTLIASAPDATVDAIEGGVAAYLLHRHRHRDEHLDHIERSIAAAAASGDRSFIENNAASRRRLAAVVGRLTPADLGRPTEPSEEGTWTIAQVLGHIAFWDRSAETRWRMARDAAGPNDTLESRGIPYPIAEAINGPVAGFLESWTPKVGLEIGAEAVAAAESVDSLLEEVADRITPSLFTSMPGAVNRWWHREEHVAAIEAALAGLPAAGGPVDRSYLERNRASRARLREIVGRLTPADLVRATSPSEEGSWIIGQALGHLAFWDRFLESRWHAALAAGSGHQPSYLPDELADLLNGGLEPFLAAFAGGSGAGLLAEVVAAADAIDSLIEGLPAEAPVNAALAERPPLLDRSIHRNSHLDDIELVIGR
jgi:hypothetical protein